MLLLFSNVGAATFFSVAGLVFGGVWELTVSVDVLGDVGQCLFLWGVMLRCYRLYRVFEIRRRTLSCVNFVGGGGGATPAECVHG